MERRGYLPKTARKPITELNAEQRLFLEYQLIGCSKPDLCAQIGVRLHEPLSVEQAADLVRIRRRFARWLTTQPAYRREWAKGVQSIRDGQAVAAVRTQIQIMNNPGDDSAAFAKVRLQAASALLGDEGKAGNTNVNVTLNQNTVNLTAGIVVRLPASAAPPPLENMADDALGEVIDAEPFRPIAALIDEQQRPTFDDRALEEMVRRHPHTRDGSE